MDYYWFDTDCFSDLLYKRLPKWMDDDIFAKASSGRVAIIVSPFVFYEVLKGKDNIADIHDLYFKLNSLPCFYVANFENIFKANFKILNGKELIKQMSMEFVVEDPLKYAAFRDGYKKQIGESYSRYIIQYCKVASIIYLLSNESDCKGHVSERTLKKIQYIEKFDTYGANNHILKELFSNFFIHYNYRTVGEEKVDDYGLMQEQMLVFINVMIASSKAIIQLENGGKKYTKNDYNDLLYRNLDESKIVLDDFHGQVDNVSKKTNNALSIIKIFNTYINNKIDDLFYKYVCKRFVLKRILYKYLNNDFIDAINIKCAGSFLNKCVNHFFTYDSHWEEFLSQHKDENIFNGNSLLYHCLKR